MVLLQDLLGLIVFYHQTVEPRITYGLHSTFKVSKGAKIRNQYNQVPHLTHDTNGKVTNSQ